MAKKALKAAKAIVKPPNKTKEDKKSVKEKPKKASQMVEKVEETKVKEDVKDEKGTEQTLVDRQNIEQCVTDIKAQGVIAIKALKKYFEDKGGKSLFPQIDYALSVTTLYKKPAMVTDHARSNIILPHSDRNFQNSTICLILPDLDQTKEGRTDPDVDKQARQWADKIEKEHDLKNKRVTIITKRQLEREYHTYHDRRNLATQHDLFMVDKRVAKSVCTFLGKDFARVHKRPLWFDYFKPLSESISNGLKTVSLPLNKFMTRAAVHIGHLGQDTSDLSENLNTVINRIAEVCPGGLLNIRTLNIEPSGGQPSLPIFHDEGNTNVVQLKSENKHKRPDQAFVVDECNTLPEGLKLKIRKNGKLSVLREEDSHTVLFPTIHDEWDERDITKPTIDPAQLERKRKIKAKRNAQRASEALLKKVKKAKMA